MNQRITYKFKPGWRYESTRHALAARGIKTKGARTTDVQSLFLTSLQEKKKLTDLRRKNKHNIDVLKHYLYYRRTGKGSGSLYSMDDAKRVREEVVKSDDDLLINKANALWNDIQAYERSGFTPARRFTKMERAFIRARGKKMTGTKLSSLEQKGLKKSGFAPAPAVKKSQYELPRLPKSQRLPGLPKLKVHKSLVGEEWLSRPSPEEIRRMKK